MPFTYAKTASDKYLTSDNSKSCNMLMTNKSCRIVNHIDDNIDMDVAILRCLLISILYRMQYNVFL